MARERGRPYRGLRYRRVAVARDAAGAGDDDGGDLDEEDEEGDNATELGPRISSASNRHSRTAREIVSNINDKATNVLKGLELSPNFPGFLYSLIAKFTMRVGGVVAMSEPIHFNKDFTEAKFGNSVIAAVADRIKQLVLGEVDRRPDLYTNLKIAALLAGKDPSDPKNLGLDSLPVDKLRGRAMAACKRGDAEEEIAFREAMLAKQDLTVKERVQTMVYLATAYSGTSNGQRSLALKEQLLAYLRSGIDKAYGEAEMNHSLPVAIYKTRLSIARSKQNGVEANDTAIDDERIAACTDLLGFADIDPDFQRDALEMLIEIYERRQDFRMALRYSLKVLGVARQRGRNEEERAGIVERTREIAKLCPPARDLKEALEVKDTLIIDELLEWAGEAGAQSNLQAQIQLREELLSRSVLSDRGQIVTLTFLTDNYEGIGDFEKALLCLERIIEIKIRIGEGSERELRSLRERGRRLMAAIPKDPTEVLAEALRNPMVKELVSFLTAFKSRAQNWVNGDNSKISIPVAERQALIDAWAKIMQNEEQIVAIVGVESLRGFMCRFRDSLKGGNMKESHIRQILAVFKLPVQQATFPLQQ